MVCICRKPDKFPTFTTAMQRLCSETKQWGKGSTQKDWHYSDWKGSESEMYAKSPSEGSVMGGISLLSLNTTLAGSPASH